METTPAIKTEDEKGHRDYYGFILWPVLVLVVYFLSTGPVIRLVQNGRIDPDDTFLNKFYAPINWLCEKTPLRKPIGMYCHLWAPKLFNSKGEVFDFAVTKPKQSAPTTK